ncbi:LytTR family DNA-binding domain-containing protein [Neolewinella lacunae]|uniref:Response regulator transcription factor n=1 Tax=Neolewinella lacunae TaxID=1517758 RepID=A0A923PI94_9BACT|nr:LytTR family DNA-binding domain-containing protein [Neolewinella lacunae]MBC6994643.1 response regulator transcription factor [Neolewinella lacunae]MDN3634515.1 LytTR family DNA-binding domain-containing protein [Neolewinella lacunae]
MNALLIDDESAAISELRNRLLAAHPAIRIVGEAMNVRDGLKKINALRPDLLFLDIEMPGGNGFELVRQLPPDHRPEIIFVTSQGTYALQAFRVAALSYILKPVDADELKAAVDLATIRLREKNSGQRLEVLLENLRTDNPADKRIGIPSEDGVEFVEASEIIYCEGVEGYTRFHLKNGKTRLSAYSIGHYLRMLEPFNFFAIHRSFLVNHHHVVSYANSGVLDLSNGTQLEVSRRRRGPVKEWLGL